MVNKKGTAVIWIAFGVVLAALIIAYMVVQKSNKGEKIVIETSEGKIVVQLYKDMPITSGNFEKLVREGFYDNILFHRVVDGFMIQSGDPLTKNESLKSRWGSGSPGYSIKDEFNDVSNIRGTISMANAGPNTGGSQFFINLRDNTFLDGRHPVFGEVVEGMNVVDAIGKVKVEDNGHGEISSPVVPIKIISARIA